MADADDNRVSFNGSPNGAKTGWNHDYERPFLEQTGKCTVGCR